jgi:ribose transport system substrate-binding protein
MRFKMLCAVLCVAAVVALAGCDRGSSNQPTAYPAPQACPTCEPCAPCPEPEEPEQEEGIYYFIAGNWQDPFYIPGIAGFEAAGEYLGVQTELAGPMDANQAETAKAIEAVAARDDTAGMFLYPTEGETMKVLTEVAVAKGIAVVNGAADTSFKARHAFVGYDNVLLGEQAAEWIAQMIGGKGVVGTMGNWGYNVIMRQEACKAYLEENYPDITVVDRAEHEGSAISAGQVMDSYLVANPDLDILWFADGLAGQMAQLWAEKQQAGVTTKFVATDMPPATLQAVKDGVFAGTVGQDTYTEAFWSVLLMHEIHLGHRVPDTVYLSAILIDSSNVDLYLE